MKKNKRMEKHIILIMLSILLLSNVSSATTIDVGKQIFDEKCRFCHGGNPPASASDAQSISALSEDAKIREASIGEIIRNGTKDGMPAYNKSDISDIDIGYLVDYLKSFPNPFDALGTTPTSKTPTNPETTPVALATTTPKAPNIEFIFVVLVVLIAYAIRRN